MVRPRIFETKPGAINVYLQPDQLEWLKKRAHDTKQSPSAIVRQLIEKERTE